MLSIRLPPGKILKVKALSAAGDVCPVALTVNVFVFSSSAGVPVINPDDDIVRPDGNSPEITE